MPILSLNQRIVLGAVIVLLFFITLTATALNKAFINSSENALKDTLTTQIFALIATAEVDRVNNRLVLNMPSDNLETLLGLPNSGLYAQVIDAQGNSIWSSESHINATPPKALFLPSGEKQFNKISVKKQHYFQLLFGVDWLINDNNIALTFVVQQDLKAFNQQLNDYNDTLWLWLGAMAFFLVISQVLILKWGLNPINEVVKELHHIEQGKQQKIEHQYPKEIEFLSNNINHLLNNEHAQKKRYRNALGDLAHSLKTPLAIIQSTLTSSKHDKLLTEQINRMDSIVEYQLQKAATAGANNLSQAIDINALMHRIIDSLQKVYRDKDILLRFNSDDVFNYKADEGDMMELFGNVLDNAFKWAKSTIAIQLQYTANSLQINISDDGPGFPLDLMDEIKVRGKRADESTPGHGIGLSIVSNIIESYGGNIELRNNKDCGGSILITL